MASYISKRGEKSADLENILLECFEKVMSNPFDCEKNPAGIINMGTSENKLVVDILAERFKKICLDGMPQYYMQYADMRGLPEFRQSLATFLNKYMKPTEPFDMDNLYVFNGCGSVIEMLGFAICDDGDCLLVPAPYYGAFKTDLACRMGCVVYSVDLSSEVKKEFGEKEPFELSVGRLEEAFVKAESEGHNVRGIILANPNNPLGNIYTKSQIEDYLKFAARHNIHVILDEIYFLSMYDKEAQFTGGRSIGGAIDPKLLHIVWGFSKDFAMSGFRCGLVHTVNKQVERVLNANAYFQSVPTPAQFMLQSITDDHDWLDKVYFPTNQSRLLAAKNFVCKELADIGIPIYPSAAGLFVWVNFKSYVKPLSREGELKLLNTFLDNGVYICPSVAFQSKEYGWFRIIFSLKQDELIPGIQRVKDVLQSINRNESGAGENLDELVVNFQRLVRESDWLENNTAEKWVKENPELAAKFVEPKSD